LRISSLSGPSTTTPASNFGVSVVVQNDGPGTAGAFRVGFYLSTDASITVSDTFLGFVPISSLGVGSATRSATLQVPPGTPAAAYNLGAIVDYQSAIEEGNEANNTTSGFQINVQPAPSGQADLAVTGLVIEPTQTVTGDWLTYTVWITNQGGTATGPFVTRIVITPDGNPANAMSSQQCLYNIGLGPGVSDDCVATIQAPTTMGTYFVVAIADFDSDVTESNEFNNQAQADSGQLFVQPAAPQIDLQFLNPGLSAPPVADRGEQVTLTTTFRNNGAGSTGQNITWSFRVGFYLSQDQIITPTDTLLTICTFPNADWMAVKSCTAQATIPTTIAPGTYYIGAFLDDEHVVQELHETDNKLTSPILINEPPETISIYPVSGSGTTATFTAHSPTSMAPATSSLLIGC
jgi:subtilase family serine protease